MNLSPKSDQRSTSLKRDTCAGAEREVLPPVPTSSEHRRGSTTPMAIKGTGSFVVCIPIENGGHLTISTSIGKQEAVALCEKVRKIVAFQTFKTWEGPRSRFISMDTFPKEILELYSNTRDPHVSGGSNFLNTTAYPDRAYVYEVMRRQDEPAQEKTRRSNRRQPTAGSSSASTLAEASSTSSNGPETASAAHSGEGAPHANSADVCPSSKCGS